MTPKQRIKREILLDAMSVDTSIPWEGDLTAENIDEAYESVFEDLGIQYDYEDEFRQKGVESDIPAPHSRNYESKSVAYQFSDTMWIGWTVWYGGGKHGEPESIEWMADAYELTCVETEKLVTVREFTKVEDDDNYKRKTITGPMEF